MNPLFQSIYAHLPPGLRFIPASLRGYYLNSWRYGGRTPEIVDSAQEREHWPPDKWRVWHEEQLAYLLHRAATRVPFYRQQWQERRRKGDVASWEVLENWPILLKQTVREAGAALVADDCNRAHMFTDRTSGTTGTPLTIWQQKPAIQNWYGLFEARTRLWYGVSRHSRWAILGGQPVAPVSQKDPPFWVWNMPMHQLYLSTFHLKGEFIPDYVKAIRDYRVEYMVGYSAALHVLARHLLSTGIRLPMKVVVTNAEPLLPIQRESIHKAFQCPVRATYGMAEAVAAASECECGTLHSWPDAGLIEVIENGTPVSPGSSGELVCTGLVNPDMPLIRYAVGDRGRFAADSERCSCGRTLPRIEAIEGRSNDQLIACDGHRIFWLNPVFYGLPVVEAQLIQESVDRVRVIYVPASAFDVESAKAIVERLQKLLGPIEVTLETTTQVPREPSGKFRAVVCRVPSSPSPGAPAEKCVHS